MTAKRFISDYYFHQEETSTSDFENFQAENRTDLAIFVNLVDLCWDLFPMVFNAKSVASDTFFLQFQNLVYKLVYHSTK